MIYVFRQKYVFPLRICRILSEHLWRKSGNTIDKNIGL